MKRWYIYGIIFLILTGSVFPACKNSTEKQPEQVFQYERFKDSLLEESGLLPPDSSNLFDKGSFIPAKDSLAELLATIDTVLSRLKKQEWLSASEKAVVMENIRMLDSFKRVHQFVDSGDCRESACGLYVHIVKSKQVFYLYISGELKDSFPVSTGMKKYTTPDLSRHPSGPVFIQYTSRKFPGGNYKGLGNMPYAVFVKGGYAIHGTTPGNFAKLGQVASHGCIRLHPDNARIFYELVKLYGLSQTWVKVTDSL
jgi:hypothetical protein